MNDTTDKPPPIVIGVQGIDASVVNTKDPADRPESPPWFQIVALPAFQMFVEETMPEYSPWGSEQFLIGLFNQIYANHGTDGVERLIQDYCQWHKAKGYWPNEDPWGRLTE